MGKLKSHTEYLAEEIVTFSLFNEKLPDDVRANMGKTLIAAPVGELRLGKPKSPAVTENTALKDLIGPQSHFLFHRLGLGYDWLSQAVPEWPQSDSYRRAKEIMHYLKVTNDTAERGIKLMTDYAHKISKDSEEQQRLYQVVEYHRKKFSDFKKSSLNI